MKKIIYTENAPAPIGPYSQATLMNDTLYCSGQIALDAKTGVMVLDSIENEAQQVMKNLSAVLTAAGMRFDQVVKCSIFLRSMDDFAEVNRVYAEYFPVDPPARETVEVARLPKDVNVEISLIAVKG